MKKISAKAKKVVDICNNNLKVKNAMSELLNEIIISDIVKLSNNNSKVKNAMDELLDAIKQSKQKITKIEKCSFSDVVINVAAKIESSNLLKI